MLFGRNGRAQWFPSFELLSGSSLALIAGFGLVVGPADERVGALCTAAFGVIVLLLGVSGYRRFSSEGPHVVVRGVFMKPLVLPRDVAVGFITQGGGRSASLVIYLTDGRTKHEVIRAVPLGFGRAERLVARLRAALTLSPSLPAARAAEADRELLANATRIAWSYYRTPAFRWTVAAMVGFVLLYVAVSLCLIFVVNARR
jgi:hypothetical protein